MTELCREISDKFSSIEATRQGMEDLGYICDKTIASAAYLSHHLGKPVLVEGPPGVGKTELAKTAAEYLGRPLIRLQCYEGLDESRSLYEWKYGKQLLYTQVLKEKINDLLEGARGLDESMKRLNNFEDLFFSEQFLEPRPLLQALKHKEGVVLLIDEIDKSDQEFEAFLLEMLSDYQVSIPEIGTIRAESTPMVFLTSNNTRELGDAMRRRCLHLHIPYPDEKQERQIVQSRVPEVPEKLRRQLVSFLQQLRTLDLKKIPAISETIDWARTLVLLHTESLDIEVVRNTLNVVLKFREDIETAAPQLSRITARAVIES